MNKVIGWILGFTKIGKVAETVQGAVEGKKQMIVSLIAALTGTLTIVANFGDRGVAYLVTIAQTPEFLAASAGWIGFFSAIKGEKIRTEIREIKGNSQTPPEPKDQP